MKKLKVEKIFKIFSIAIIVLLIAMQLSVVFAADELLDPGKVIGAETNASNSSQKFLNSVLGIVQIVAVSVAVIMLIILGIKYISAAPGEKADIKQGAMIYVVGAILMFGATAIIQVIKGFTGQAIKPVDIAS